MPSGSAPLLCLPNELLASIFEAAAWSQSAEEDELFEMTLSHVSQRLRDVAITTPTLWRRIVMWELSAQPFIIPRLYLSRSKDVSLDITISLAALPTPVVSFRSFLDLLVPHIDRWRTLRVSVFDTQHLQIMAHFLKLQMPTLLELIEVHDTGARIWGGSGRCVHDEDKCYRVPADENSWRVFTGGAPSLRTVHLHGRPPILFAPLDAVQTLHLCFLYEQQYSPMRTWITGSYITCLIMHGRCNISADDEDSNVSTISFPSLTSLYMLRTASHRVPNVLFLNRLEAPELQLLWLEGADMPLQYILTSSSSRFPILNSLILHAQPQNEGEGDVPWVHMAQCFPTIETLTFLHENSRQLLDCLNQEDPLIWSEMHTLGLGDVQTANVALLVSAISGRGRYGLGLIRELLLMEDTIRRLELDVPGSQSFSTMRALTNVRSFRSNRWPSCDDYDKWCEEDWISSGRGIMLASR